MQYILFDLDGTLTDPKAGITKSVAYALKRMIDTDVDPETLTHFIGPPLKESFMTFYGMTESEALQAIEHYRTYFKDSGMLDNFAYEGIEQLLERLKKTGKVLAVATSKPTPFAERILEHFNLAQYFEVIVGSNLDGTRTHKDEVVEATLQLLRCDDREQAVMVGDREHDVIGARKAGLKCVGVTYGYGGYEELNTAGAAWIVEDLNALERLLTKM
ncbi:HAD family hydrolase [Fusibacter paucivorans]|uniref:HAD family hydrolase n=1 Tax=Fusibacter paucivorans TaxID=76009 RepID=A0ABS5PL82_9FIRM|nr:HAD family hydrolase [Fusibacter paucivorans]MBS7525935.1 HAD family hydrolase [Fusibacter paucivorans]